MKIGKGSGAVKYKGYNSGGTVKPKGLKNKRSAHARKEREKAARIRREAQARREEREDRFNDWENDY